MYNLFIQEVTSFYIACIHTFTKLTNVEPHSSCKVSMSHVQGLFTKARWVLPGVRKISAYEAWLSELTFFMSHKHPNLAQVANIRFSRLCTCLTDGVPSLFYSVWISLHLLNAAPMFTLGELYRVHSKQRVVQGAWEFGLFPMKTELVQFCLMRKKWIFSRHWGTVIEVPALISKICETTHW